MDEILDFIKEHKLVKRGDVVGVGVSGGVDSMCLLHYLNSVKEQLDIEVVGIHINHGIREESFDEAKFVIFPSIILVIPEERLYELSNLINERKEETSTSNSEEEFTDTDDEQFDELMEGDEPDEIL